MPRTEDVPGAQDRCVQPTFANQGFAFGSHGDTGLHHRSWLRDAHVDEMLNARANSPDHRLSAGNEVNALEFRRLGGTGVSHSD
jgi:hypothetical protein